MRVDPAAVHAVGGQEGYSGRVGDGGHAFGPFQLNDAGGVLTGRMSGASTAQKQAWALSPQGIDFALERIAKVSAGQTGRQAVGSIVSRFERPADIPGEIARANATLGHPPNVYSGQPAPKLGHPANVYASPTAATDTGGARALLLQAILNARQATGTEGPSYGLQSLLASAPANVGPPVQPSLARATAAPAPPAARRVGLAELLHEGVGGPTHSTGEHIHAAFTDPQSALYAIRLAEQMGLHVGENPYTGDTVDPVHAKNSYHYRDFPGTYSGKRLGEAIDASGSQGAMRRYYNALARSRA